MIVLCKSCGIEIPRTSFYCDNCQKKHILVHDILCTAGWIVVGLFIIWIILE